ncbi:MAG: TIM barrel protein [Gammaproteobacteria bacterium]|nr:TIM barrel protein [Gammaproteobacteria bacterium]
MRLLLDTGHALYAGADPAAVAQTYGGRIAHVHCKDVRRAILDRCLNSESSFSAAVLDSVFTVPGDGCVDFQAVLSVLRQADYEGWLIVEAEQDPSVAPPARYANMGYENLQRLIGLL